MLCEIDLRTRTWVHRIDVLNTASTSLPPWTKFIKRAHHFFRKLPLVSDDQTAVG